MIYDYHHIQMQKFDFITSMLFFSIIINSSCIISDMAFYEVQFGTFKKIFSFILSRIVRDSRIVWVSRILSFNSDFKLKLFAAAPRISSIVLRLFIIISNSGERKTQEVADEVIKKF